MHKAILTLRGRVAWAHDFNPDRTVAATFQALDEIVVSAFPCRRIVHKNSNAHAWSFLQLDFGHNALRWRRFTSAGKKTSESAKSSGIWIGRRIETALASKGSPSAI